MCRALNTVVPVFLFVSLLVTGCASSTPEEADHASFSAQAEAEPTDSEKKNDQINDVLTPVTEGASAAADKTPSPHYSQLMELLKSQGIEGVGLEYEEATGLTLLIDVFSDPKVPYCDIALVYTGLEMSYDKRHKSLTVGGLTQKEAIVSYIRKHVPRRRGVPVAKPPTKKSPKGKVIRGRKKTSSRVAPKRKAVPRIKPKAPPKPVPAPVEPPSDVPPPETQPTEPSPADQPAAESESPAESTNSDDPNL